MGSEAPSGHRIFSSDNAYPGGGACAALTAMWIRRTYESGGDLKMLSQIGSRMQIEIAQSAAAKGSFGWNRGYIYSDSGPFTGTDFKYLDSILSPQQLRIVGRVTSQHTSQGWNDLLWTMIKNPGMYFSDMRGGPNIGHVVGFKTGGPNLSGYWCFDPNKGLYLNRYADCFVEFNAEYLMWKYPSYENVLSYHLELR